MTDNETTVVIFRRWPGTDRGERGDVLALFPEIPADVVGRYCTSYQHVGQHGAADLHGCIRATKPAKVSDPDVAALARELEAIGYRLDIRERASPAMRRRLLAAL